MSSVIHTKSTLRDNMIIIDQPDEHFKQMKNVERTNKQKFKIINSRTNRQALVHNYSGNIIMRPIRCSVCIHIVLGKKQKKIVQLYKNRKYLVGFNNKKLKRMRKHVHTIHSAAFIDENIKWALSCMRQYEYGYLIGAKLHVKPLHEYTYSKCMINRLH